MRTTVRLDDELTKQVKEYAVRHGRTLTAVLEDGLRQLLAREQNDTANTTVDVVTFSGAGLRPGVDLENRHSLQAILEEEDIERFRNVTNAAG